MATTEHITTAEQLLTAPGLGRCELVQGELIMMSPAGFDHGRIVMRLGARLHDFVEHRGLGVVTGAETGFFIAHDPDTVRAPDVGFLRAARVPPQPIKGFFPGPPDLAVEVLSPDDRAGEVLAKVHDWLAAGCLAVWVADPEKRTVTAYQAGNRVVTWNVAEVIDGGDVLPELRLPVADVFGS